MDKPCPNCGHIGDIATDFGYREIRGKVRPQSWCISCRSSKNKGKPQPALKVLLTKQARDLNKAAQAVEFWRYEFRLGKEVLDKGYAESKPLTKQILDRADKLGALYVEYSDARGYTYSWTWNHKSWRAKVAKPQ